MERVWVECMYNTNGASCVLTVGKQYYATIIDEYTYRMENDKGELDWFSKDRFKVITDNNEILVECINKSSLYDEDLTVGKVYKVIEVPSDKNCYVLQNDNGKESYHSKIKFKPVNKTPILTVLKTDMRDNLKEIRENFIVNINFKKDAYDKIEIIIEESLLGTVTDVYTISSVYNDNNLLEKVNLILKYYNIQLELEQPKFKINCDKLYTKEEADKLKENGIDLVEVK